MIDNSSTIKKAANIIKSGGLVSFPTETVYALSVSAFNENAIARLYQLKARSLDKPFAILARDIEQIKEFVEIDLRAYKLLYKYAPGPLTIVVNLKASVNSKLVFTNNGTLGIRIPDHELALSLIEAVGHPIVATSANLSNIASSVNAQEVTAIFGSEIDMIIDGGDAPLGIESTVIDLSKKEVKLLRQGFIPFQEILHSLNDLEKL